MSIPVAGAASHPGFPVAPRCRPVLVGVRSGGFTLTELLIAIGLLALLASLLGTAASRVRASGESTNCLSNQRQLFLATTGYLGDNRNRLPSGYWGTNVSSSGTLTQYVSYDDLLADYDGRTLTDKQKRMHPLDDPSTINGRISNLYRCPAEKLVQKDPDFSTTGTIFVRTYALNRAAIQNGAVRKGIFNNAAQVAGAAAWSARLSEVRNPATTIYLAEMRYLYSRVGSSLGEYLDNAYSGPTEVANDSGLMGQLARTSTGYFVASQPLHGRRWNYLFLDGHSANLAPEETLGPGTATTAETDSASMWWR